MLRGVSLVGGAESMRENWEPSEFHDRSSEGRRDGDRTPARRRNRSSAAGGAAKGRDVEWED